MTPASNSEGAHSIEVNCDSSESTIGINIKTLDSQTYSLRVNKNIPVPALKEKIVTTIGVPPEQQRLIYRGKVLKDEQLLSELHMEDGDTLHLVVRQPVQSQPTSSTGATEASRVSSSQANDSGSGVQRNRVGQVAHSILLGTVNVADRPGEAMLADLSRSIEAFLSSLGLVTVEPTGGPSRGPSVSALNQASSGAGAERSQDASRTEPGNSAHEGFMPSNSPLLASTQFSQLPFVRTLNQQMVIPDALTTLSEFINRMELVLQSGSSSLNNAQHQQHPEASSLDARGLPTPEFLCYVMERAQQLLRDNATSALLNVSTRLQREGSSSDPVLRGQIQTEAMQLGVAMQHLGAMLLELGRTIMTLRMGQSPSESSVNAGPAVYISPTGPNPIMVQPSSLFGISSHPLVSGLSVGASPGNPLNNINVQLHTGSSIAPGVSSTGSMPNPAEAISGERPNTEQTSAGINVSNDSISTRGLPLRTVISATPARTVPEATGHVLSVTYPVHIRAQHSIPIHFASPQGAGSTLSGGGQPHEQTSVLPPSDSVPTLPPSDSVPTFVAQITARIANALTGNAQVQSSSASMQSIATHGSHSVVASGTQSDLSNSTLQPPQMNSSIVHTAPSIMQSSLLCSDSQSQNPLSRHQTSQGSNSREENELACPEDLFSGNDGAKSDSINVGGTEHMKQSGPGECHTSDLSGSGKEAKQLEGNQFGCVGSGFSVEETSATSSSNIPADCHPTCIQSSSSDIESSKREPDSVDFCKPTSSNSPIESNMPTPLGLGFGGLQPKKRSKPVKPKVEDDVQAVASSSDQSQHSIASVREALCSLPSQTTNVDRGNNANGSSSQHPSLISQFMNSMPSGGQGGSGQTDFAGMIANAMQSSAFNNLLTGVASQSTVSTGDLRSMLEQCVQSPAVQNTVNQLVQQVGQSQDNGNIQGTGQNRLNFTGMIQQMLPVVSQALGRASTRSALVQDMQSGPQPESNDAEICAVESLHDVNHQLDLSQALEKIEQHGDPRSIFGTLLEIAGHLYGEGNFYQDIVDLGNDEELANEFMEVLKRDIIRRLEEESISENKS